MNDFIQGFLVGAGVFTGIMVAATIIVIVLALVFNRKSESRHGK